MAVRQSQSRWLLALLACTAGCLNAPQESPRGTHSLRMADILSTTPGLNGATPKVDPLAARLHVGQRRIEFLLPQPDPLEVRAVIAGRFELPA